MTHYSKNILSLYWKSFFQLVINSLIYQSRSKGDKFQNPRFGIHANPLGCALAFKGFLLYMGFGSGVFPFFSALEKRKTRIGKQALDNPGNADNLDPGTDEKKESANRCGRLKMPRQEEGFIIPVSLEFKFLENPGFNKYQVKVGI